MNRKRVFDIIQIGNDSDTPSRAFDIVISGVILTNILVTILQTFEELAYLDPLWKALELLTLAFFIVEYILRVWTAQFLYPNLPAYKARWKFISSFDGVVELLTILPLYAFSGIVAFRMLRVVRIFHLFRINAYYDSFHVIKTVLYEKRNQIMSSVFIVLILMLASSLCIYSVEHDAQPEQFSNAFSGLYWSMSTLLTVGYGDIIPITTLGRLMTMVMELLGVGLVAIPTGIISAGFVEQYSSMQKDLDTNSPTLKLQVVVVDIDSSWIGKTPAQLREENGIVPVLIERGSEKLMPMDSYRVQVGDALTVHIYEEA